MQAVAWAARFVAHLYRLNFVSLGAGESGQPQHTVDDLPTDSVGVLVLYSQLRRSRSEEPLVSVRIEVEFLHSVQPVGYPRLIRVPGPGY